MCVAARAQQGREEDDQNAGICLCSDKKREKKVLYHYLFTMNTDANKTRLRIKIKRWHGVAKWTWGVGDDEDDVCIVCQSAFEGVAPGVKYPGDECPVVVSAIFFVGSFMREIYVDSALEICLADANHVHLICTK